MFCHKIRIHTRFSDRGLADIYIRHNDERNLLIKLIGTGSKSIDTVFCLLFKPDSEGMAEVEQSIFNLTIQETWGRLGSAMGQLNGPSSIVQRKRGQKDEFYVSDSRNHRIVGFSGSGNAEYVFGGFGRGKGYFNTPNDLAITSGLEFIVSDSRNRRIVVTGPRGHYIREITGWLGRT
ncbi:MAG: hypothetical protein AB1633_08755, partial [Elusimicrobiota bacterium]